MHIVWRSGAIKGRLVSQANPASVNSVDLAAERSAPEQP
jgi:hypothetical protein